MREIVAATYQCEPRPGDVDHNLDRFESTLGTRPAREADLVVAPEMFATGWVNTGKPQPARSKAAADRLGALAREYGVFLATSVATWRRRQEYNTFHLWDPRGRLLGTQDKIHLWDKEADRRTPGHELKPVRASWGVAGGLVCYDVEFPEVARSLAEAGTEVFLVPSAFYSPRSWDIMTRARALENGCFLVASNQVGVDPKHPHNGHSRIVDPYGNVLAEVHGTKRLATATLDPKRMTGARAWAPFLRDRRIGSPRP